MKSYIDKSVKNKMGKIDKLFYSIVNIEFRSIINRNKTTSFAFNIIEYMNECCFLINEFAVCNYKKHSRFLI
jgi:hypothetical protein